MFPKSEQLGWRVPLESLFELGGGTWPNEIQLVYAGLFPHRAACRSAARRAPQLQRRVRRYPSCIQNRGFRSKDDVTILGR